MPQHINQKLIAERAGISRATVSRAFTKSTAVSAEAMELIISTMKDLGISDPEKLIGKRDVPRQILVIVGDIRDEFYASTIKGISDTIHSLNMIATLCDSNFDFDIEYRYLKYAEEHGFAGVIMLTVESSPGMIALLRNYTLPVVLVNRFIRSLDMDVVSIDNYRGGYMAASYLLEHGHRCVAYLAGKRESTAQQDRLRGFTDAMADAGISFRQQNVFWGDNTRDSGRDFAGSFFRDHAKGKYTAVFAANNPMAVGALTRLLELGRSVPNDISMICFDDVTPARDGSIKLTTISYDPYLMGTTAVDSLMKRIEKPHQEKIKSTFSPHVTVRDSVKDISASIDKHL